jgi:Helicase conserved C-terminal domain
VNRPENERQAPGMKLLPHQANFVETVFSPSTKRTILLRADVGLGRSTALVAVAGRLLAEKPTARALFLVPAALRTQFAHMLRDANVSSVVVDRYTYREMLDTTAAKEFWPSGTAVVLGFEFARQPDVRDSLALCKWDIVFVYEWLLTRGARAESLESLRHITASAERVVLANAEAKYPQAQQTRFRMGVAVAKPPDRESSGLAAGDATVVEWRPDLIVDPRGNRVQGPDFHFISFRRNPPEMELKAIVGSLEMLGGDLGARKLFRCLESSPAALERPLQALMTGEVPPDSMDTFSNLEEPPSDDIPIDRSSRSNAEQVAGLAARALQKIEAITSDSKLDAFGELLSRINPGKSSPRRVLVLTDFVATLFYLAADIEGHGLTCQLLHGSMSTEERVKSLDLFSNTGVILVATRAVIAVGADLGEITDLVLYDPVPRYSGDVSDLSYRFNRFARVSRLTVYFFGPLGSTYFRHEGV